MASIQTLSLKSSKAVFFFEIDIFSKCLENGPLFFNTLTNDLFIFIETTIFLNYANGHVLFGQVLRHCCQ